MVVYCLFIFSSIYLLILQAIYIVLQDLRIKDAIVELNIRRGENVFNFCDTQLGKCWLIYCRDWREGCLTRCCRLDTFRQVSNFSSKYLAIYQ